MTYPIRIILALSLIAASALPAVAHPEIGAQSDGVAEVELRIFLDMNPQDAKARTRLGFILYRKNRLKDAEREFAQVLAKAPRDADAMYGFGIVKLKDRKPAEALQWLQKALGLNGEQSTTYLNLGLAYQQTGRPKEAETILRQGLEVCDRAMRRGVDVPHEQETRRNILAALQSLPKNSIKGTK